MTKARQENSPQLQRTQVVAQRCLKQFPVTIILGSGASAESNIPGMDDIRKALLSDAGSSLSSCREDWMKFKQSLVHKNENEDKDFEEAIEDFEKHGDYPEIRQYVAKIVWQKIAGADWRAMLDIAHKGIGDVALARLFSHLIQRAHGSIDVVTTNYDRVAESAVERVPGLRHYTGFTYGQFRRPDEDARREHLGKVARVWKVHGSIDWFVRYGKSGRPDEIVAFPTRDALPEGEWQPAIVLPGSSKYELTHREPFRTIMRGADDAIARAKCILCVGFGFRDAHILPELWKQCEKRDTFLVILAKKLTPKGEEFLESCRCDSALVLTQDSDKKTMIRLRKKWNEEWTRIYDESNFWCLRSFMNLIESQEPDESCHD